MADINVLKEKTLEDYNASSIQSTSNARPCDPYAPVTVPKDEEFLIADFKVKVTFISNYNGDAIWWSWETVSSKDVTVTLKSQFDPTIKEYYDLNKSGGSPAMDEALATQIEAELRELFLSQQQIIKDQVAKYLTYSKLMVFRTKTGADELSRVISAYAKVGRGRTTHPPINLTGRLFIRPNISTSANSNDNFSLDYNSPKEGLKTFCEYTTCLLAEDKVNFVIKLDNLVDNAGQVDTSVWDTTYGLNTINGLTASAGALQAEMIARGQKQQSLMQQWSQAYGDSLRTNQILREWINNQRTTIQPVGDGFFKFGLSSGGAGVIQYKIIIPFGEGGLYFNSITQYLTLNPVNLFSEISFWQQYAARVREAQNLRALAYSNYIAGLKATIPPFTDTTPVTLNPELTVDAVLPVSPEVITAPENSGGGNRDIGEINFEADLTNFDWSFDLLNSIGTGGIDGFKIQ